MKKIFALTYVMVNFICNAQEKDSIGSNRFTIHAQATVVNQIKSGFKVPYSGSNSLVSEHESQTSITSTLFLGTRLWKNASVFVNPEIAGGSGLSQALGIADATNGETFRVGNPSPKIYLARAYYTQLFALSDDSVFQSDDMNQIQTQIPERYVSITFGKVSLADFFDANTYSHDPRTQFMSWGLMDNGAWDYAANTRGYTPATVLEYVTPKNEFRYAFALLPIQANGNDMNWNINKQYSHTAEFTHHYDLFNLPGTIRFLSFFNSGKFGNYDNSLLQNPTNPDVTLDRKYGRTKFGFGINAEQQLNAFLGGFFRASWNDGKNETWVFTEIDRTASLGISVNGKKWNRNKDTFGLAYVTSGLSKPHQEYLKAGGNGFILGDGNLNYAWEHLIETYYSAELIKNQMFVTGAYQLVLNPGYNADRSGPVNVFSIRVHIQL